jgi:hypothetical protein
MLKIDPNNKIKEELKNKLSREPKTERESMTDRLTQDTDGINTERYKYSNKS